MGIQSRYTLLSTRCSHHEIQVKFLLGPRIFESWLHAHSSPISRLILLRDDLVIPMYEAMWFSGILFANPGKRFRNSRYFVFASSETMGLTRCTFSSNALLVILAWILSHSMMVLESSLRPALSITT